MAFTENINGYLTRLAGNAILSSAEKASIKTSITTLKQRINSHFFGQVTDHFIFGSYSRGTILPRRIDEHSDVDYMIVFSDANYQPQTYLNKLRRFVELYYNRSEIVQSHPTIQLKLGHICFELVPATKEWFFNNLRIPAKASDYSNWVDTDPTGFNGTLVAKNQEHKQIIKPLVRVMKYWNARNAYPFESYELERFVVSQNFNDWSLFGSPSKSLKDCFYTCIENLSLGWSSPQWKRQRLEHVKKVIRSVEAYESAEETTQALNVIKHLLPMV